MSLFKGKHLRVSVPRTTDGSTPQLVGGTLAYKEEFLPISAKRDLELKNKFLPDILKMIIEEVDGEAPKNAVSDGKDPKAKK